MSPRAAWRLETLGFTKVYDYVAGKHDWFAAGLPREGRLAGVLRAGDVARRDDVTCRGTDRLGEVVYRVRAEGKDACIVVADGGVVLGRVRGKAMEGDPGAKIEDVMEAGPTTTGTDTTLKAITERLRGRSVKAILVTTSDGRLIGTLYREDAERRLDEEDRIGEDETSCDCDE